MYPHTICSSRPDLSGDERGAYMTFMLETPFVSPEDYRTSDFLFHNTDSISCGLLMTTEATVSSVYESNGVNMQYVTITPLLGSMKIVAQTVNIIEARLGGAEFGAVSISTSDGGGDGASEGTAQENQLGLRLALCPGTEGSGDEIVDSIKGRFSDVDGVVAMSFYSSQVGAENAQTTDRMGFWTASVDSVAGMTQDDGSNYCVDTLLSEGQDY